MIVTNSSVAQEVSLKANADGDKIVLVKNNGAEIAVRLDALEAEYASVPSQPSSEAVDAEAAPVEAEPVTADVAPETTEETAQPAAAE